MLIPERQVQQSLLNPKVGHLCKVPVNIFSGLLEQKYGDLREMKAMSL